VCIGMTREGKPKKGRGDADKHVRDRSCLLRCSLLLKARAQNWHLYFRSGCDAEDGLRTAGVEVAGVAGTTATLAAGIVVERRRRRWQEDDVVGEMGGRCVCISPALVGLSCVEVLRVEDDDGVGGDAWRGLSLFFSFLAGWYGESSQTDS
jgi:hypothetical protein